MNPLLQTPFLLCIPLLLLLSSSSSIKLIKADGVQPAAPTTVVPRPGCPDRCGNVSIAFPFGVGAGCFLDPWFEIICNASNKPFLLRLHNLQIIEMTIPYYSNKWLQSLTVGIPSLNACGAQNTKQYGVDLRGSPYNFSTNHNVFLVEGCSGSALLTDQAINKPLAGCSTTCHNQSKRDPISTKKCFGDVSGCCRMDLPSENSRTDLDKYPYGHHPSSNLQFYKIGLYGQSSGECIAATLIKDDSIDQYIGKLWTSSQDPITVPVLLYWSWVSESWPVPKRPNGYCLRDGSTNSTHCRCNGDSVGNPFLLNGCQHQAGCKNCNGYCIWNEEKHSHSCVLEESVAIFYQITLDLILVSPIGTLLLVCVFRWLFRFIKRRRKTEQRVRFFKLNLQRHQSDNEGVVERTKLFSQKMLDKATDHFNENRILGKGGQGIVYKGMLIDGTIVAIKMLSKFEDGSQMKQFINEVVILSTINHRNVVKLLGCCLETEAPLLVYEFISNGTLSQHLHYPSEDFVLTWATRLKIAADSAGAVAYLHSSSSTPVYHRDIKPANILLDDKHIAKVSDFGSSKAIEIDQTHLTTLVHGTFGYLDPEYFESNIFTEKSDVYSFGIVLLELLTTKKPSYRDAKMEQKSLVVEFFIHLENSNLLDLLDPKVVKEAKGEELLEVVNLAKCCLQGSGRSRPTMREVAMTLEMIIKSYAEMSTHDQQTTPAEGFSGVFMPKMEEIDFMSSPVSTGVGNPLYIDVHPQLHNTI